MSITTRNGDDGTTRLFSGEIVSKDSPRTDAYGDVDELGSILGVARAHTTRPDCAAHILAVQRDLFVVCAELATTPEMISMLSDRVDEARLAALDVRREAIEAAVTMPKGFVVPGESVVAAHLDHARTVARRCERKAVRLTRDGLIDNPTLVVWLNRLSDFLWLLARLEEGEAVRLKDAD